MITALLVAALSQQPVAQSPPGDNPDQLFARGLAAYDQNKLDLALPLFRRATQLDSSNMKYRLYLAESAWRQEHFQEARTQAMTVLASHPCNGFAHLILSSVYNPQYSIWEETDHDSVWVHLSRAIECDPDDGNIWFAVWAEAMRRGDLRLEATSLESLMSSGVLTPSYLALARWVLESTPPETVVLTHGDLDTYPLLAVQLTERRRPDVGVVNEGMLNLPWYAGLMSTRYSLPLPVSLDSLRTRYESGFPLSDIIVRHWRSLAAGGNLHRPLAFALTTGVDPTSSEPGSLSFRGPFYLLSTAGDFFDQAGIEQALERISISEWQGEAFSPSDRSPVRRAYTRPPILVPLIAALGLMDFEIADNDLAGVRRWEDWSVRMIQEVTLPGEIRADYLRYIAVRVKSFERNQ